MLPHLGAIARQLRRDAGVKLVRIGASLDKSEASLSRFESGKVQPEHLDETVKAYAEELGISVSEIWAAALEQMCADGRR